MAFPFAAIAPFVGMGIDALTQNSANKKTMRFNERMANTEWQRGVKDMLAAGLNPMLAVSQGGNSAPTVNVQPLTRNTASTALAAQMQQQQLQNMDAQTKLLLAQERNVKEDTSLKSITATQVAGTTQHLDLQMQRTGQEIKNLVKQMELTDTQIREKQLTNEQLQKIQPLVLAYQELVNKAQTLGMTQKEVDEKFARDLGEEAKWLRFVRDFFGASKGR